MATLQSGEDGQLSVCAHMVKPVFKKRRFSLIATDNSCSKDLIALLKIAGYACWSQVPNATVDGF